MPTTQPPSEQLAVISQMQIKPECLTPFLAALEDLLPESAAEPGLIRYEFMQARNDPTRITFVDIFENEAAFQFHLNAEHLRRFGGRIKDFLAAPPTTTFHTAREIFQK